MTKLTIQSALTHVMVTTAAADGNMSENELKWIGSITDTMPVFSGMTRDELVTQANDCTAILDDDDGLEIILDMVVHALPERLYDTAYAVAVEVAAADLSVAQEELRFLQMLRDALDLDKLVVAAIERSARARFRILDT